MGKKKFSSSGFAQPELDLPAARKFVREHIGQRVKEWRQQNPELMTKEPGRLTYLTDFVLRRQANGSIKVSGPEGTGADPERNWPQ